MSLEIAQIFLTFYKLIIPKEKQIINDLLVKLQFIIYFCDANGCFNFSCIPLLMIVMEIS